MPVFCYARHIRWTESDQLGYNEKKTGCVQVALIALRMYLDAIFRRITRI